ncbi:hypothetical protein [Bacillus alkalicola]|uniref:Uncharacterized protein n=1 Tax=Evansella alkalicola TaxID=745819 RepID=A0ABS6K1I9_9BACI|nr:hypothetical protein [Bacillus alkalicola]MBU9723240.1 hypothetical protein [Bacillus alkalicola]
MVTFKQVRVGQVGITGGEKSEQWILVNRIVGKVVMSSDLMRSLSAHERKVIQFRKTSCAKQKPMT